MSALGYHLVLRLDDDRVIAPSRALRRRVAVILAELSRTFGVVCWKLADTHLHLLVVGDDAAVTELVRRLRLCFTLALQLGVSLELQRRKPLSGQSHLESVFHYVLRQDNHHGIETDRFQDASALPDILGLRVLAPEQAVRVRELLPRLSRTELLRHLGLETLEEGEDVRVLAEAALAAFGLEAFGRDTRGTEARRAGAAAVAVADRGLRALALGVTAQSITRLSRASPPARHVRAVRLQMALRAQVIDVPAFVKAPAPSMYAVSEVMAPAQRTTRSQPGKIPYISPIWDRFECVPTAAAIRNGQDPPHLVDLGSH